jgi:DNA phosphorothioation-dependent restriction protein DptH
LALAVNNSLVPINYEKAACHNSSLKACKASLKANGFAARRKSLQSKPWCGIMVSKAAMPLALKTMNDTLQAMLSTVLRELSLHFPCKACPVRPAYESASCYVLRVVPGMGVAPKKVAAVADCLKLRLKLSAQQDLRFAIDNGAVSIEVPKQEGDRTFVRRTVLEDAFPFAANNLIAILGQAVNGSPVAINFSESISPHLLIGGTTGSGKSVVINSLLEGLCNHYTPDELRLLLIDPKQVELCAYEDSPHLLCPIGYSEDDALDALERMTTEMDKRYALFKAAKVKNIEEYNAQAMAEEAMPWLVMVLDEYADLTNDKQAKRFIEEELQPIAAKGRAAGIHIILATQKPSAAVISTTIRSNFPAKLALRVCKAADSRILLDENGAETLAGKGDALLSTAEGLVRLQTAM